MYHKYSLGERLLALFLSAVLVLGMVPVNQAAAAEGFAFAVTDPENLVFKEGLTYTNAASGGEGEGAVTYTITAGKETATIDETGTLTILAPGTVTVQAVKAADGEVQEQTAEYTIQIDQPEQKAFAFAVTDPENLVFKEGLTYTNTASGGKGDGEVTYALLVMPEVGKPDPENPEETLPLVPEETDSTDVASVNTQNGELTVLKAGSVTVRAIKAADGEIPKQTAEYTLQIELGEQTDFVFSVNDDTFAYSATTKYTNVVAGGESTGEITYAITAGAEYAEIDAQSGAVTTIQPGTISVTATKAADEKYREATASYTLLITKGTQTGFAFAEAEPEAVVYVEGMTYENAASGGESTGNITYAVTEGTDVATVDEKGKLTIVKHGTVTVTATKAGDDKYNETSTTYTLKVTKQPQTGFAFEKAAPDALDYADELEFTNTAFGGEGTGSITYAVTEGADVAAVDEEGKLTIAKHGTVTVTATKAEDDTYAEATASYTLTINGLQQDPLMFAVAEPDVLALEYQGMTYTNAATGGSGTGALTYAITEGSTIARVDSNGIVTITGKGTIKVTATKAADNAYEETSASYTLIVGEAQEPIVFETTNPGITYSEDATYQQAPIGGSGNGAVSYTIRDQDWAVAKIDAGTGLVTIKKSGEIIVTATKAADGEFAATKASYTLKIEKADQTGFGFAQEQVEITYNDNDNQYTLEATDGESTDNKITYEIVSGTETAQLAADGTTLNIQQAGSVVVKATKPGDDCYNPATAQLTLSVKKASQTITFVNDHVDKVYGIANYTNEIQISERCNEEAPVYEIIGDNKIGATIKADTGELTFANSDEKVGSITVRVTKGEDACYESCSDEYTFTLTYAESPETAYTLSGDKKNESGWYTGDVTITPAEGYLISFHNLLADNEWAESVVCTMEGEHKDYKVYLKQIETGNITDAIVVEGLKIDKTNPINLNIEYKTAAWYEILGSIFGVSKNTVEVIFKADDLVSKIGTMEYSLDGGETYNPLESKLGTYSISVPAQYRDKVVLRTTDVAGNSITTLEDADTENNDKTLVVDDVDPVINHLFSGEWNYNEKDDIHYASDASFAITFTVTDDNYDLREKNPVVKVNDKEQDLSWSVDEKSGKAVLTLSEAGHYTVTAEFTDRSGNEAEMFNEVIYVDLTPPECDVDFSAPSRTVDTQQMKDVDTFAAGDKVVTYYNAAEVTATIVITEANFRNEDVFINVNGHAATLGEWKNLGNDRWENKVTLTEEGDYVIDVSYTDRAKHEMTPFQSQRIVIDRTLPIVEVAYANKDVKNNIDGRDYFDNKQTAIVTIRERNFRADDVKIMVTAKDAAETDVLTLDESGFVKSFAERGIDRSAWTPYAEGTWRNENDTYELTLEFADDANYTFDVEYTDLATNKAGDYQEDAFTVDKPAPVNLLIEYAPELPAEKVVDGVYYYNDVVDVNLTAEDGISGIHYFVYSYINADGVSSVNAQLLDQRIEATRDGAKGTASFQIPKEKLGKTNQFNGTVSIIAVNRSEKKTDLADTRPIVVDSIAPVTDVTYSTNIQSKNNVDYYADNIDVTIHITEANFFADDVQVTVIKDGDGENPVNVTVNWSDLSLDAHKGTFTLKEEGHYVVEVAYTDRSGNVQVNTSGEKMELYTSQELVLDRTAPTQVRIEYEDEQSEEFKDDKFPKKFIEFLEELLVFYYNEQTTVTLTATDRDMEGIELTIAKNGSEGATSVKLPVDLVIGADGTITGDKGDIQVTKDDVTYADGVMTVTCGIPEEFRGALDIVAVDMSHNEESYQDTTIVVVDTIGPRRTVTYKPNRAVDIDTMKDVDKDEVKEGDNVVLYYAQDAEAVLHVTEENFYAEDVNVTVKKDGEEYASQVVWSHESGDTWQGVLTLKEEGDYVVYASYLDRARNEMIPYQSQRIVVDKTAPVITTKYSNADVKNSIDGRDYFASAQTVTITIKEHNFRADDVLVTVSGKNAAGTGVLTLNQDGTTSYEKTGKDRTAWTAYKEGTWRNDNDTYELTLTFADDANYTFDVEYEDLATNQSTDYAVDAFTVDKTAPTGLSISYSESVLETILDAITFGFYNERVTVTINATDETSGIHYFVYSYLNAADVSSVNAELANQKIQASGSGGAGSATFMIPKDALRSNNQFNGTVNFTTYDRSENSSSLADKERIVVDNISPEVTVEYNTPVQTVEDVTFYDDEITCTIKMDEANFYSEDVKMTVTKDGKEIDVTVSWTRDSADRNTGTFTLKEDGEYTVSVEYTDKSGNKMVDYVSKKHTLDTTHPKINVSNIKANSANKDEVYGFVIDIYDINLDAESMKPVLTAVLKDENGIYTVKEIELGNPVEVEEGIRYTYTVENLLEDALYTLTCTVLDMAENETIEMLLEDGEAYEEVEFSINRNGSTFAYGNGFTEKLVEQYYVYSVDEDIVIVEVNVDPIETYVIKLNGEDLTEGKDYTTTQTSNEGEWSRRIYYIDKDLFEAEGEYNIVVSSVDKAETTAFSDVKDLTVAFVVDQTKPVVTITGLESGGRYQTDQQTVTLIPTDEGGRLNSLAVVVFDSDGNPLMNEFGEDVSVRFEMSGDEFLKYLEEHDGKVTFTIPEGLEHQVQIVCSDCAINADNLTNEYNELFERVTVSQNKLVIFYANKPLFYGSIAGTLGILLLLIIILVKRKKKNEDQ